MINEKTAFPRIKTDLIQNPRFYMGIGLLLIFIMAARSPLDTDMWWHLRAGEWMVQNGQPLVEDIFSLTRSGSAWINHSWLSEIILYLFFKTGGALGLSFLTAGLAVLSMGFIYYQMEGSPLFRAFILILVSTVAAPVWSPRPQMFTLVMLAATELLLYRYRRRETQKIWLLIPLFILWSNLHGGYVLGIILIAAVIAGSMVDNFIGYTSDALNKKELLTLGGWTGAAWLSVAINPNGTATWLIPFKTVGVTSLQNHISEWASPDFHQIAQWPFVIVVLLIILAVGNAPRRLNSTNFVIMSVFTALTLAARRNFGPFALISAPILTSSLIPAMAAWQNQILNTSWGKWIKNKLERPQATPDSLANARRWINLILIILLVLAGLAKLILVSSEKILNQAEAQIFPVAAVEWIQENHPTGNMISSYDWGGYLQWNLREYPVFIDGRTDLYDDEIIQDWLRVVEAESGWQSVIDRWEIELALLEPTRPAVSAMSRDGWQVLYQDDEAVLLRK